MIDAPLALAFSAGLVAAFNPCGFALLPAYLSFFVGSEGSATRRPGRALLVAGVVSLGFVAVFGVAGLLAVGLSVSVSGATSWLTLVIGIALVPLGIAMIRGWEPVLRVPRLQRGGRDRGLASMLLFGISYATVSLGCTLPVFLAAVASTFRRANFASGMAVFGAYALGMSLVLMVLTLAVGLAHAGLIGKVRRVLPYVGRISGALLVVAGAYVAYYGWFALRLEAGADPPGGIVDVISAWSAQLGQWVADAGAWPVGVALGLLVVIGIALGRARARSAAVEGRHDAD